MRRHTKTLSLTLSVLLMVSALPLSTRAQQSQDEIQAQIQAELELFLQTSTEDGLRAEVWRRVNEAEQRDTNNPPSSPIFDGLRGFELTMPSDDPSAACARAYTSACRSAYNADIAGAAAQATTVLAGCLALTTGLNLIVCASLALAVQQFLSLQARDRYQACLAIIPTVCDIPIPCAVERVDE